MTEDLSSRIAQLERQVVRLIQSVGGDDAAVGAPAFSGGMADAFTAVPDLLAPLQALLDDDSVNDILINGHDNIFVERGGKLEKTNITFADDGKLSAIAEAIAIHSGRTVGAHRPLLDARLPDGSRVNVIVRPLAVDGTAISIRKFSRHSITLDDMQASGNISPSLAQLLKVVARCRLNVLISGGTGSGKTTLLNAISEHIDGAERIVTIEDSAELKLQQPHVVRLETRPMRSSRCDEEVTVRDLMKNALRMRPDRIIIGEVRGAEAFDMMQAMNTGHEGSLTTIHANHPRDALARLENMITMANLNLPNQAIRSQMASAIHLVIQVSRMRDGHRRVTFVSEVVGMESEIITMQDLFVYNVRSEGSDGKMTGDFKWTGIMPRFLRRAAYYGEAKRLSEALGVMLPKV